MLDHRLQKRNCVTGTPPSTSYKGAYEQGRQAHSARLSSRRGWSRSPNAQPFEASPERRLRCDLLHALSRRMRVLEQAEVRQHGRLGIDAQVFRMHALAWRVWLPRPQHEPRTKCHRHRWLQLQPSLQPQPTVTRLRVRSEDLRQPDRRWKRPSPWLFARQSETSGAGPRRVHAPARRPRLPRPESQCELSGHHSQLRRPGNRPSITRLPKGPKDLPAQMTVPSHEPATSRLSTMPVAALLARDGFRRVARRNSLRLAWVRRRRGIKTPRQKDSQDRGCGPKSGCGPKRGGRHVFASGDTGNAIHRVRERGAFKPASDRRSAVQRDHGS